MLVRRRFVVSNDADRVGHVYWVLMTKEVLPEFVLIRRRFVASRDADRVGHGYGVLRTKEAA